MNRGLRPTTLMVMMVTVLCVGAVVLTGCPKKPALVAGAGSGSGAGPSASGTPGAGLVGPGEPGSVSGISPGRSGEGPGPSAGHEGSGAGPTALVGGTPATGTTIPALPPPKEFIKTPALPDIHFDFDRYEIRPHDAQVLDENARWLKAHPNARLLIEGHADDRGTNEYNLALGDRRAKATRDHLISLGIAGARITVITYGEERPLCSEDTEVCWAQNRRAHFLVKEE